MKITCVGYLLVMLSVYIAWTNFLSYGDDIVSSCNLKSFVTDNVMFLNDIITDNIIMLTLTLLSFLFYFYVATALVKLI